MNPDLLDSKHAARPEQVACFSTEDILLDGWPETSSCPIRLKKSTKTVPWGDFPWRFAPQQNEMVVELLIAQR
jgi:hypothetical protein